MSKRKGRSLERLVALVERALAGDHVQIESPASLPDARTGKPREHDVLLTFRGHHGARLALECRDRSRPVGVPQLEGFYQKCLDTRVGGAIVSSSGFYRTTKEKAASLGVRCLELNQLDSVDWVALSYLVVLRSELKHTEATFAIAGDVAPGTRPDSIVDESGAALSNEQIIAGIKRHLASSVLGAVAVGPSEVPFKFAVGGVFAEVGGKRSRINGVRGVAHYDTSLEMVPFQFIRYDEAGAALLAEAAVAHVDEGELKGRLAFTRNKQGVVMVSFTPEGE